jgi:Ser/Thr protein kinase RdoA (MazF antagonist)
MHTPHPTDSPDGYEQLTPDVMLDALASVGLVGDGRMLALSSYENRVVQFAVDDATEGDMTQVVAKFYRPHRWSDAAIQEEHDFALALMAGDIPMVAPMRLGTPARTLHHFAGYAFSVSPSRGGRRPELDDLEVLEWIGRLLARLHNVGAQQAFAHRPAINPTTYGDDCKTWLLDNQAIPLDVQRVWCDAFDAAMAVVRSKWALFEESHFPTAAIRLHGDCHPGNILWTPNDGPHFVDLDDARSGPAVQDLWMLLSGERHAQTIALSAVLDGYEQMRPFNRAELALIEPLRTLRMVHYSTWLAKRWDDPAFAANFPWFGSSDYWHGQVHQLQEQVEAMQAPSLSV